VRIWVALAALDGLMAVSAGAFGAHGVRDPQIKALLHTGAQYQAVHAAAAIACYGLLQMMLRQASLAGWLFTVGGLVFGGSLYLLAFSGQRWLGAITPIGGLLMMAGWAVVIWGALAGAKVHSA
jgi:uncharacterized membrane protein YgdD (TMEM256/DUF423 family)